MPERITWTRGFRLAIDKQVLGALSTFADFKTGARAEMRLATLAQRAGVPRRTLSRSLRRLEADGWVTATRRHRRPTRYDINLDLLATCWNPVESLLKTSVLSATHGTQLSATHGTQDPVLSATGGTPSPVRTDPLYRDPLYEEAARGAALPPQQLTFGPLSLEEDAMALRVYRARSQLNVGEPCDCLDCQGAGVTHLRRVRVPADTYCSTPRWLHGQELRTWWEAHDRELAAVRARLANR